MPSKHTKLAFRPFNTTFGSFSSPIKWSNNKVLAKCIKQYIDEKERAAGRVLLLDGPNYGTTRRLYKESIVTQKEQVIIPQFNKSHYNQMKPKEGKDPLAVVKFTSMEYLIEEMKDQIGDIHTFYFDGEQTVTGHHQNKCYPLESISNFLINSTRETLIVGVTFTLRSNLGLLPHRKNMPEQIWEDYLKPCFAALRYKETLLTERKYVNPGGHSPQWFAVIKLEKIKPRPGRPKVVRFIHRKTNGKIVRYFGYRNLPPKVPADEKKILSPELLKHLGN